MGTTMAQAEHVTRAFVGQDGLIHILNSDGREFVAARDDSPESALRKDPGFNQQSVEVPKIAVDGKTVGWIVNFGNCCTSYPIPLMLVVYQNGRVIRRITPSDLPPIILDWHFVAGGKEIAISTSTLHGDSHGAFELYMVKTGRLIQRWDAENSGPDPAWVQTFGKE